MATANACRAPHNGNYLLKKLIAKTLNIVMTILLVIEVKMITNIMALCDPINT
jgi:hypothetical protein